MYYVKLFLPAKVILAKQSVCSKNTTAFRLHVGLCMLVVSCSAVLRHTDLAWPFVLLRPRFTSPMHTIVGHCSLFFPVFVLSASLLAMKISAAQLPEYMLPAVKQLLLMHAGLTWWAS